MRHGWCLFVENALNNSFSGKYDGWKFVSWCQIHFLSTGNIESRLCKQKKREILQTFFKFMTGFASFTFFLILYCVEEHIFTPSLLTLITICMRIITFLCNDCHPSDTLLQKHNLHLISALYSGIIFTFFTFSCKSCFLLGFSFAFKREHPIT